MTVAIGTPFVSVHDSNGNPYVSAKLYVYVVNTTTLANIYSDTALSVAITNPMTSDASGNFARAYIAAGVYKLRAETAAGALIWQYDYIDTGLLNSGTLAVASGGTGSTTAAGARTALGAAAQTDVDTLNTTVTSIQSTLAAIGLQPQGYLTMTSATPVIASDVTAGTSVYYALDVGNLCPVFNGTTFDIKSFSELTLTLVANHTASSIYDVFVISDSGTVRVVTGPAWNTATAGAGARGTGAGTTELERTNGLWTNKNSMTARNGASTYTVAAHCGTYVGSIFMDGTNGQLTCHRSYGQSRKWGVWNMYNRKQLYLKAGDPNASWVYNTNTLRASRNDATNSLTLFVGQAEEIVDLRFLQHIGSAASASTSDTARNGIGYNSIIATSGKRGLFSCSLVIAGGALAVDGDAIASFTTIPAIGIHTITALEITTAQSTNVTYYGTETDMVLRALWRG